MAAPTQMTDMDMKKSTRDTLNEEAAKLCDPIIIAGGNIHCSDQSGSLPTKAEVLKAIYESGVHQDNPMMILTLRRNGKLVEEPSAYAMVFARRLAENKLLS